MTSFNVPNTETVNMSESILTSVGMQFSGGDAFTVTDLVAVPIVQSSFLGQPSVITRSIFVKKGPIAKPPLVLYAGGSGLLSSATNITLPGTTLTSSVIGKRLKVTGSLINNGDFLIRAVLSTTSLQVQANFQLPDPANGALEWRIEDPRDGYIADNILDVTVRVNNTPVIPEYVAGLRGQVVLPSVPASTDTVAIDYYWIKNPTVEFRALNDRSFVLNGVPPRGSDIQHTYQYRSVLINPNDYSTYLPSQNGTGGIVNSSTQLTLPGANLTQAHVGKYIQLSGANAGQYRIVSVLTSTTCVVA